MSDTDKQWNDVNDAAANQEAELEKALQQAEEMQEALRQADQAISETEDKIKQLPPIGADVNTINQQLEDIKVRKVTFSALQYFIAGVFKIAASSVLVCHIILQQCSSVSRDPSAGKASL